MLIAMMSNSFQQIAVSTNVLSLVSCLEQFLCSLKVVASITNSAYGYPKASVSGGGQERCRCEPEIGKEHSKSWLVRSTSDRVVLFRALAEDTVLCSWARHFTLSASLHPGHGVQMGAGESNPAMD